MTRLWPIVLAACALTSKTPPRELRYFSPPLATDAGGPVAAAPACARLRLARVTASAHLRMPIVHRDSAVEVAPYETLRWTEAPDSYARRAIVHAVFERRRLDQAVGGDAPALEVELVAFEEVRRGDARAGRVELRYVVADEHRVRARGTIVREHASDASIESIVAALGRALDEAAATLAGTVYTVATCEH
jgi:ABC-type uncharacterized transport system auxiliary subunit